MCLERRLCEDGYDAVGDRGYRRTKGSIMEPVLTGEKDLKNMCFCETNRIWN